MNSDQIYIISDVEVVVTLPDDSTQILTLPRPNDLNQPYKLIRKKLRVSDSYRDPTFNERDGYNLFELEFHLSYEYHRTDLTPLLISKSIELKVPTYLYKDSSYYQSFDVRCINEEFTQAPYAGIKVAAHKSSFKGANPIPNQGEVLRFKSGVYTWDEFKDLMTWYQPSTVVDDNDEPVPGFIIIGETEDTNGLIVSDLAPSNYGEEVIDPIKVGDKIFTIQSILLEY